MTNARILSESWTLAGSSVCSTLSPSAGVRSPKLLAKINVGGATSSNLKGEECSGKIVDSCVYFLVHDTLHMDHVLKHNLVFSYSSCVQTVTVVLQQS